MKFPFGFLKITIEGIDYRIDLLSAALTGLTIKEIIEEINLTQGI